jgi:hypothetical protein
MTAVEGEDVRRLRLKYPALCAVCGIGLSRGAEALWDRAAKTPTCIACADGDQPLDPGVAGASAEAEAKRRSAKRVEEARRSHGDHAAAVAEAVAPTEHEIAAWRKGSDGESRLAAYIEREVGDRVIALHDRLIPGTRNKNIDHIFVAPTGVWVVDSKAYKGKVVKRDIGPFWREENTVYVGGRDRSDRAKAVESQVEAVLAALRPDPEAKGTEVHAALCFVESEWGLLDFPFKVGSVWVLYPGALRKRLKKNGPVPRERMQHIAKRLALSFPNA